MSEGRGSRMGVGEYVRSVVKYFGTVRSSAKMFGVK
jgi:hypothetical protein